MLNTSSPLLRGVTPNHASARSSLCTRASCSLLIKAIYEVYLIVEFKRPQFQLYSISEWYESVEETMCETGSMALFSLSAGVQLSIV